VKWSSVEYTMYFEWPCGFQRIENGIRSYAGKAYIALEMALFVAWSTVSTSGIDTSRFPSGVSVQDWTDTRKVGSRCCHSLLRQHEGLPQTLYFTVLATLWHEGMDNGNLQCPHRASL